MNEKHLLAIFFNEDYSKNIPILEGIYADRFPHRLYIVPDHHTRYEWGYRVHNVGYRAVNWQDRVYCKARRILGKRNRHELKHASVAPPVVRVTGFKYYFQDFFWQARKALLAQNADWYWFVADDLLLNPEISESSVLNFFRLNEGQSRTVICKPHYRRDEWVNKFHAEYQHVVDILRKASVYALDTKSRELSGDPHHEGPNRRQVIAGCSDFFGCHGSLLGQVLQKFHFLALYKIFVEVAVPNVVLSIDKNATTVKNYIWEFSNDRGNDEQVRKFVSQPGSNAFYHPVKLAAMGKEMAGHVIRVSNNYE